MNDLEDLGSYLLEEVGHLFDVCKALEPHEHSEVSRGHGPG